MLSWMDRNMTDIQPTRALVIAAHPDDAEYFCGGTVGKWIKNGCIVSYVITSSGDKGSNDVHEDAENIIKIREMEQKASAYILGVQNIIFLRYPDSELSFADQNNLREEFVRYIRMFKPEVILSHDPFVRFSRQHPDHRVVGQLTIDASFPISSMAQCYKSQILEEGLSTHQPVYLLLFGTDQANYWVDINDTLDLKVKSLQEHRSQENAFAGGIEKRLHWKAHEIGKSRNLNAAEEFLLVKVGATMPES